MTKNKDETDMADDDVSGGAGGGGGGGAADDEERDQRDRQEPGDREARGDRAGEPQRRAQRHPLEYRASEGGGFFHVYKSGQGYWTRMGTAAGAALIILGTAAFFYENLPAWVPWLGTHRAWLSGIILASCAAMGLAVWYVMNKPVSADFLIATDSEMKKVNWTSKTELIGSTKVVIFFVIAVAILLFVTDLFFGYLFYWIGVLKAKPF